MTLALIKITKKTMENKRKEIGKVFKSAIKNAQKSKYRIMKDTGLTWQSIQSIEQGSTNYTIDSILTLAEAVGLHINFDETL